MRIRLTDTNVTARIGDFICFLGVGQPFHPVGSKQSCQRWHRLLRLLGSTPTPTTNKKCNLKRTDMKKFKSILCLAIWTCLIWQGLSRLSQSIYDEDIISAMSQDTYDEIVDTLTRLNNGLEPSERQIVTYYFERNGYK